MNEPAKVRLQDWESYAEALIRAAQQAGEFDNLPGFGQPIPGIDAPHDEWWWVREKLRREQLRVSHSPDAAGELAQSSHSKPGEKSP